MVFIFLRKTGGTVLGGGFLKKTGITILIKLVK